MLASADESEAAPSAEAGTSASALTEEQGSRDDDVRVPLQYLIF